MADLTLGSLFSGAGGFELAGSYAGFTPLWASEIEPFPIRVTSRRFPDMIHLGDITQINGAKIPPVNVITFGSPCQDLSIAGKRKGLGGTRSGLFLEAVRIIKEMRVATSGIYPRFIVWENVPGAFSSNKGGDFRTVLEEIVKIADEKLYVPQPKKWTKSGEILGDGFSLAFRTYDAQFWGVPQRRRRIFLVADFGGESAGRVSFEREGLLGDIKEGGETRLGTPQNTTESLAGASGFNGHKSITGSIQYGVETAPTIEASMPPNLVYPSVARTLSARYDSSPCIDRGQNFIVVENHPADSRFKLSKDNIIQTLSSRMGTGGNNEPMILESHQKSYSYDCRNHNKELSATLQSKGGSGGLNYINPIFCLNELKYIVRRLTPLECCRLQGFEDFWCTDLDTQKPTKKEIDDWAKVFETHRNATNPKKKPKTRKYIEKWLKHPQSNSAEYKMWGNSLCVNCAYTVLKGIADELGANQKTKVRHHGEKKAIGSFHLEYPKQESFPARQMD